MTQRSPGSTFSFDIQGDSHPERPQQNDPELYRGTLLSAASDQPDFYLTIGDNFSVDNLKTVNVGTVTERYTLQREFLGLVGNSALVFLVNGNHEQAARYNLHGTPNNVAVWVAGNHGFADCALRVRDAIACAIILLPRFTR